MFGRKWALFFLPVLLLVGTGCTRSNPEKNNSRVNISIPNSLPMSAAMRAHVQKLADDKRQRQDQLLLAQAKKQSNPKHKVSKKDLQSKKDIISALSDNSPTFVKALVDSADLKLQHVSINITKGSGPEMAPILFVWDRNKIDDVVPSSFPIGNVPIGSGRLIQVVAAYSIPSSLTDNENFVLYYGDVSSVEITYPETSAPTIVLNEVLNGESSSGAQVAGRFISSYTLSGTTVKRLGPSGVLSMLYAPAGKPAMVIEEGEILNGWFKAFVLSNLPVQYVASTSSGTKIDIFNGPVSLNSSIFQGSNKVMRLNIPAHYRINRDYNASPPTVLGYQSEEARTQILGFFGDTNQVVGVCRRPSYVFENRARVQSDTAASRLAFPSSFSLSGGAMTSDGTPLACGAGSINIYDNALTFFPPVFDRGGGDMVAGYVAPFQLMDPASGTESGMSLIQFTPLTGSTPQQLRLDWKYLPGIDQESLDGVSLFARALPSNGTDINYDYKKSSGKDGIDCSTLSDFGFNKIEDKSFPSTTLSSATLYSTAAYPNGVLAILCPYKISNSTKVYLHSVAESWYWRHGDGGGGSGSPATQAKIMKSQSPFSGVGNGCSAFRVQLFDASNNMAMNSSGSSYAFNVLASFTSAQASSSLLYNSESDCYNNINPFAVNGIGASQVTIASNQSSSPDFYIKVPVPVNGATPVPSVSLSMATTSGLTTQNLSLNILSSSDKYFYIDISNKLYADVCYPAYVEVKSFDTYTTPGSLSTSFNIVASGSNSVLYSASDCSTTATTSLSRTLNGSTPSRAYFGVKITSAQATTLSSMGINIAATGGIQAGQAYANVVANTGAAVTSVTGLELKPPLLLNTPNFLQCVGPFTVSFKNSVGEFIPLNASKTLNFEFPSVAGSDAILTPSVWDNSGCTTAVSSALPSGTYKKQVFIKFFNAKNHQVRASIESGSIQNSVYIDIDGPYRVQVAPLTGEVSSGSVSNGKCTRFQVGVTNFKLVSGAPVYYNGGSPIEVSLSAPGVAGVTGQLYEKRSADGKECAFPIPSNIVLVPGSSAGANHGKIDVYFQPINNSAASGAITLTPASQKVGFLSQSDSYALTVLAPTVLASAFPFISGNHNIPYGFPFDLRKAKDPFTGISSFNYFLSGSGLSANNPLYSSIPNSGTPGQSMPFSITDSRYPTPDSLSVSASVYGQSFPTNIINTIINDQIAAEVSGSATLDNTTLWGFSRSFSAGYSYPSYYDKNGDLQESTVLNEARFDHKWDMAANSGAGGAMAAGLLIEGYGRNLVSYSEDFSSHIDGSSQPEVGSWRGLPESYGAAPSIVGVSASVHSPRGTDSGISQLIDNDNSGSLSSALSVVTDNLEPDTDYISSIYIKNTDITHTNKIGVVFSQPGRAYRSSFVYDLNNTDSAKLDFIPISQPGIVSTEGSMAEAGIEKLKNNWRRVWIRLHTDATGSYPGRLDVYPSFSGKNINNNADTTKGNEDRAATGEVYVFGGQIEKGSQMTSYIKNVAGATGQRKPDALSISFIRLGFQVPGTASDGYASLYMEVDALPGAKRIKQDLLTDTRGVLLKGCTLQDCSEVASDPRFTLTRRGSSIGASGLRLALRGYNADGTVNDSSTEIQDEKGFENGKIAKIGLSFTSNHGGNINELGRVNMATEGRARSSGNTSSVTIESSVAAVGFYNNSGSESASGKFYIGNNESANDSQPVAFRLRKFMVWKYKLSPVALGSMTQ